MWSRLRTLPTPISTAVRSLPRTAFSRVLHLSHVHRPRVRSTLVWRSCESLAHLPELGVRVSLAPARRARVARPCSACACRSPQLGVRVSLASARRAPVVRPCSACACRSPQLCVRVSLASARRAPVALVRSACAYFSGSCILFVVFVGCLRRIKGIHRRYCCFGADVRLCGSSPRTYSYLPYLRGGQPTV